MANGGGDYGSWDYGAGGFTPQQNWYTPGQIQYNQAMAEALMKRGLGQSPTGTSGSVTAVSPLAKWGRGLDVLAGQVRSNVSAGQEKYDVSKGGADVVGGQIPGEPGGPPRRMPMVGGGGPIQMGYAEALKPGESGGNYQAIGQPTADGDRAYGAYQIMGKNIGPWSQKWLGYQVTPQQLLASPQLQDLIARHQMNEYVQKYGPEGAGRAWYGGEGNVNNPNVRDPMHPNNPTVGQYGQRYMAQLAQQGGGQALGFSGEPAGQPTAESQMGNMVSALSGRATPPIGPPAMGGTSSPEVPAGVLPQKQMVPRQQMYDIMTNPSIDPAIKSYFLNSFFGQFQPMPFKVPEGTMWVNPATGERYTVPDVQSAEYGGPAGIRGQEQWTYQRGADGRLYKIPITSPRRPGPAAVTGPQTTTEPPELTPQHPASPAGTGTPGTPPPATPTATPPAATPGGNPFVSGAQPVTPQPTMPPSASQLQEPEQTAAEAGGAPPEITKGPEAAMAERKAKAGGMLTTPPPGAGQKLAFGETAPATYPTGEGPPDQPDFSSMTPAERIQYGVQTETRMKAQEEYVKQDVDAFNKDYGKLQQSAREAPKLDNDLARLETMAKDPRMIQGPGFDIRMNLNKALQYFGDEKAQERVSLTQAFQKIKSSQLLTGMRQELQGLGQIRLAEIDILNRAAPGEYNTLDANLAIIEMARKAQQRTLEFGKISNAYKQGYRWDPDGALIRGQDGRPIKFTEDRPTQEGLNDALRIYQNNNPLYSDKEIADYNRRFDADKTARKATGGQKGLVQPGQFDPEQHKRLEQQMKARGLL